MEELWKAIPGFEGYYEASNLGRIRSIDRIIYDTRGRALRFKGRVLKQERTGYKLGYLGVNLCKEGRMTRRNSHSLIAKTFLGIRPSGLDICHNDGDRTNNKVSNLRYDTPSSNSNDAVHHGKIVVGERHYRAKLTINHVRTIRLQHQEGQSTQAIASKYGVSQTAIWKIVTRRGWRHVT